MVCSQSIGHLLVIFFCWRRISHFFPPPMSDNPKAVFQKFQAWKHCRSMNVPFACAISIFVAFYERIGEFRGISIDVCTFLPLFAARRGLQPWLLRAMLTTKAAVLDRIQNAFQYTWKTQRCWKWAHAPDKRRMKADSGTMHLKCANVNICIFDKYVLRTGLCERRERPTRCRMLLLARAMSRDASKQLMLRVFDREPGL